MVNIPWIKPIRTKEGKFVMAHPHEATFRGRHNAVKAKVLIILHRLEGRALSLSELANVTGESYGYIGSRLAKWVEWGYLKRSIKLGINRPVYGYSIAKRGVRFVKYRIPHSRKLDYLTELNRHKAGRGTQAKI